MAKISHLLQKIVQGFIGFYQYFISPCLAPSCRFYPSCSHYAVDAIRQFGLIKGIGKAIQRILRCHPWSLGGYDPIKPNEEKP